MYYTASQNVGAALADQSMCYVPGHSLGHGWTRHIVELTDADVADNPLPQESDARLQNEPVKGPGLFVYDVPPEGNGGVKLVIYETARDFYKTLSSAPPKEAMQALVDYIEGGCVVVGPKGLGSVLGPVKVIQFWLAGNKD